MDKRKIENERVKNSIENALLTLMRQKNFSDISVSDIIRVSQVARTSYYRNYDSKEDIIDSYIEKIHTGARMQFVICPDSDDVYSFFRTENFISSLKYYQQYASEILLLYDTGFGSRLLEKLNEFSEFELGDMPADSIERYNLYLLTGAAFNFMIRWMKNGMKESPEELVLIFDRFLKEVTK